MGKYRVRIAKEIVVVRWVEVECDFADQAAEEAYYQCKDAATVCVDAGGWSVDGESDIDCTDIVEVE